MSKRKPKAAAPPADPTDTEHTDTAPPADDTAPAPHRRAKQPAAPADPAAYFQAVNRPMAAPATIGDLVGVLEHFGISLLEARVNR